GCHTSGFCDNASGGCTGQVSQPDGTPCVGGVCISAACVSLSASNAVPTSIDPTVPMDLQQSTSFLYTGGGGPQTAVAPNAIVRQRASVLNGRVFDRSGTPIENASALVPQHPEYGVTVSGADGAYHLAINGGEQLEIEIQALGYLPARRSVFAS